jgi:NADH-quinone oxidoreductase subunit D
MAVETREFLLNMGPQHPSTHGVLRVILKLDDELVLEAEPVIGYLHRGVEKIAENRTYKQFIPHTDRMDYLSSMLNNWGYVRAVEKLAGIEIPKRAEYIRVIVGELNRIASHLMSIGPTGLDAGAFTLFLYAFRERERILTILEKACGARMTYAYFRFGGVTQDLNNDFINACREFLKEFPERVKEYEDLFVENPIFKKRAKGVGVLSKELALSCGASGPVLRGSGIPRDLRKTEGYSVYSQFDFEVPVGENGDSWDRTWVRLEEMRQSARIIEQALENISEGPYLNPDVPRLLMPPPGEAYAAVESPRGEQGYFVVSDGSYKPYRVKVRSPAFSNLSLLPHLLPGHQLADVPIILGSLDPVFGEVDR